MSQYGFILDSDLLNEKSKIYEVFTSYFGNPELTKIENKKGVPYGRKKISNLSPSTLGNPNLFVIKRLYFLPTSFFFNLEVKTKKSQSLSLS